MNEICSWSGSGGPGTTSVRPPCSIKVDFWCCIAQAITNYLHVLTLLASASCLSEEEKRLCVDYCHQRELHTSVGQDGPEGRRRSRPSVHFRHQARGTNYLLENMLVLAQRQSAWKREPRLSRLATFVDARMWLELETKAQAW